MRPWMLLFGVAILGTGCTHTALERRTVKQASTLTDLQYRQVLDNVAMFSCNPEAMPWHVRVKGGLVQIADQGSGQFGAEFGLVESGRGSKFVPGMTAQRGVVNQWELDPVADSGELELLGLAYRKAVNPRDPQLREQTLLAIWQLSLAYDIRPGFDVLGDILVAAIQDNFDKIQKNLRKGNLPPVLLASGETWEKHLENAKTALEEAVKSQMRGAGKREERLSAVGRLSDQLTMHLVAIKQQIVNQQLVGTKNGDLEKGLRSINMLLEDEETFEYCKFMADEEEWQKKHALAAIVGAWVLVKRDLLVACLVFELGDYINDPHKWDANWKSIDKTRSPGLLQRILSGVACPGTREKSDNDSEPENPIRHLLAHIAEPGGGYFPIAIQGPQSPRNIGLVDQAREKLEKLKALLNEDASPWYYRGQKKDVPKCACYVGCYRSCGRECYVWVMPEQLGKLREFTLTVMSLAPSEKQESFIPRGAAFSPSLR